MVYNVKSARSIQLTFVKGSDMLNRSIRYDEAMQELIVFFFVSIPLLPKTRKPRKIFTGPSTPR
jgi:hypothetical protein